MPVPLFHQARGPSVGMAGVMGVDASSEAQKEAQGGYPDECLLR